MSDIAPIGRPNLNGINGQTPRTQRINGDAPAGTRQGDTVELSATAQYLSQLKDLPDVREELVARVRAELDAGTYETSDRIDAAVDALADDLNTPTTPF